MRIPHLISVLVLSVLPCLGADITLTATPGPDAAPGTDFTWTLTLTNNTASDYVWPESLQNTFPFSADVTFDNFNDFFNTWPDGLPAGDQTNIVVSYAVPANAVPGSQIGGDGSCCYFEIDGELYGDAAGEIDDGPFQVQSNLTYMRVASGEETPVVPEPSTLALFAIGFVGIAAGTSRKRTRV